MIVSGVGEKTGVTTEEISGCPANPVLKSTSFPTLLISHNDPDDALRGYLPSACGGNMKDKGSYGYESCKAGIKKTDFADSVELR